MSDSPYTGDVREFCQRSDMDGAQKILRTLPDGVHQGWIKEGIYYEGCLVQPSTSKLAELAQLEAQAIIARSEEETAVNRRFERKIEKTFQDNVPESVPAEIKTSLLNSTLAKIVAATIATSGGGFATVKISDLVDRIAVLESRFDAGVQSDAGVLTDVGARFK